MTLRIRIDLSYDGTAFSGWAAQPGRRTVEDTLSDALTTILRSPTPVRLVVAGRTDAGVHARGQVCHADVDPAGWGKVRDRSGRSPEDAAATRLRGILPADLTVRRVSLAPEGFDARFSALRRRYLYRICDDPATLDPLRRFDTVLVRGPLDVAAMDAGPPAACSGCTTSRPSASAAERDATTVRTLLDHRWERAATARSRPRSSPTPSATAWSGLARRGGRARGGGAPRSRRAAAVLQGGVRDSRVRVMPPHGLSLEEVTYPPDDELAARAAESRVRRVLPG